MVEGPKTSRFRQLPLTVLIPAVLAILAGFSLALAPIMQPKVVVSWPQSGDEVVSTVLLLANETPHELDVRFDGAAIAAAAEAGDGTVLATVRRDRAEPLVAGFSAGYEGAGLAVVVDEGALSFASGGRQESFTWSSADEWRLVSTVEGMTIARDGVVVADWPEALPPQIDALLTDAEGVDADSLSATVQVVDDSATSPTVLKIIIMIGAAIAAAVSLVALRRDDRARPAMRPGGVSQPMRLGWPALVLDVVVVGLLVVWVFVGSMTADDGYYAAMAYNNGFAGYVGQYFQLFNQPFTPFVWFWQFLDLWQEIGGRSAVWLRLPSLVLAVSAWFVIRAFVARYLPVGRWLRLGALALAGMVMVTWWSAFAIGSRPESTGAFGTVLAVLWLSKALTERSLLPAFGAVAVGSLAFTAHPTGIVALVPVILAVPALWGIASERGTGAGISRALGVAAGGVPALIAGFNDGGLHDALLSSARFQAVETPRTWMDEFARYNLLLETGPQGSYIKRLVVLMALLLVLWFIFAWIWDKRSGKRLIPVPLQLAGWTFALGYIAIWITTSKWSHHFGAMSAMGGLFVGMVVIGIAAIILPTLSSTQRRWVGAAGALSLVPVLSLSFAGPNSWFSWNAGLVQSGELPHVGPITFASPLLWAVGAGLVVVVLLVLAARSKRSGILLAAPAIVVATAMVLGTSYMFATFTMGALRSTSTFSTASANLKDPTGDSCLTSEAVRMWDAASARHLSALNAGDAPFEGDVLPQGLEAVEIRGDGAEIWTTLDSGGVPAASTVTTDAWAWPETVGDERVVIAAGGRISVEAPTRIEVEYVDATGVVVGDRVRLSDVVDWPGWRTIAIPAPAEERIAAFRLVLSSTSIEPLDWIASTGPGVAGATTLAEAFDDGQAVSMHWMTTFWFPCERAPEIANGIIEPPAAFSSVDAGGGDLNPWRVQRGGIIAGVQRLGDVVTLDDDMAGIGPDWGNLHVVDYPAAIGAYDLEVEYVLTTGWRSAFDDASQVVEFERR